MTASNKSILVALVIAGSLSPSLALAAPSSGAMPTAADIETARELYRDAVALHRQDKLQEALARAIAAYRTVKTPVIALELGKIEAQMGRLSDAYDVLHGVDDLPVTLRETDKGRDARREAASLAASLKDRLATLKIALPNPLPADTEVWLDGERTETGDQAHSVDPGAHTVGLHVGGRACASSNVTVQEGETRAVDLRERAAACAGGAPDLSLVPAAERSTHESARAVDEPAPAPDRRAGDQPDIIHWVGLGVAGAGVISIAGGAWVALRAKSDYDAMASQCPSSGCSPIGYEVRQTARAHATAGTWAMGLGLAAAAGGAALWFFSPRKDDAHPQRVGVAVAPNGVWMSVAIP